MIKACPCITVLKAFTHFGSLKALMHQSMHLKDQNEKSTFPSCFQDAKYPSKYAQGFLVRLLVLSSFILGSGAARASLFMSKSNFSSFTHNYCARASGLGCSWALLRIQRDYGELCCCYCCCCCSPPLLTAIQRGQIKGDAPPLR